MLRDCCGGPMADQIVFLVHGMGHHAEGWHQPWVKALAHAYNRYPAMQSRAFETRFEFVPVSYDPIFRGIVEGWQSNAQALAAAGVTGIGAKLTRWLKDAGELKDNFAWTHAADVLLYRLFDLAQGNVCAVVAERIKTTITAAGPGARWSVIAHSLGTSVLHDTLARMWANDSVWARDHRARLIAMVANVSRILERKKDLPAGVVGDVLASPVRPGVASNYFLNLEHALDPFIWPRRFHPFAWPDAATLAMNPPRYIHSADPDVLGRSYVLDHIHGANVHDFEHYLASPKAHVPLFRMLLGEDEFIPAEDERRNRDQFPQFGKLGEDLAIRVKLELEEIGVHEDMGWDDLGALWKKMAKILKDLK
jgi:hypothetical protein